ncbi:hypothetical protein JW851_02625 [Candidatus Woesearchaeota archaeon]|nr:hypothetical protein [Candidatus Woesearchaeota archaeon]
MPEQQTIVPKETMSFEGVFSIRELRNIIMDWMSAKAYIPVEEKAQQVIKKNAKFFEFKFKPYKKLSDYAKCLIKITISAFNCKDVIVPVAGKKRKMQDGKVLVKVEGILETDYEAKWEIHSVWYAVRVIAEKYVLAPFISHHAEYVKDETHQIISQIRSYLNLQKRIK